MSLVALGHEELEIALRNNRWVTDDSGRRWYPLHKSSNYPDGKTTTSWGSDGYPSRSTMSLLELGPLRWAGPQPNPAKPRSSRTIVLEQATAIVSGERQDQYGNPEDSFQRIADYWTPYLGKPVTPKDVAMLLILMKVAREQNQHKLDSLVDIAGYAALAAEVSK